MDLGSSERKYQGGLEIEIYAVIGWRWSLEIVEGCVTDLPYHAKHTILLLRSHCFSLLVVRIAHQRVQHFGVKDTLTEVRSRYWIPQERAFMWEYINHCVIC